MYCSKFARYCSAGLRSVDCEGHSTWCTSFSHSSKHSLPPRNQYEPINPGCDIKTRSIHWIFPACVSVTTIHQNVCLRICRACTLELFAAQSAHGAYCRWQKVCLPVCQYMWMCLCVCVCEGQTVCASAAPCGRKQFSQLLKKCPKLSRHRRMFLTRAPALFYRAPQGFTLSATLFQTWTWDKTRSGAAPDWRWRQSRWILACLNKSVTGSRYTNVCSLRQTVPLESLSKKKVVAVIITQNECFYRSSRSTN